MKKENQKSNQNASFRRCPIYVVDATAQSMRPIAGQGAFADHKLPTLEIGWDKKQSNVLVALQKAYSFVHSATDTQDVEDLRKQLFPGKGWLLAVRLDPWGKQDISGIQTGTGVAFFNLTAPASSNLELETEYLSDLFNDFTLLRPLVDAFENKDTNAHSNEEQKRLGWEKLNAALSERLVGISAQAHSMRSQIANFASRDYCVLVQGESGTGKELAARALHRLSNRSTGQFVAENCSAIPDNLLEGVLFGYIKGAFTGAEKNHEGLITKASGGTLFLYEIGDLPLSLQAKLLRVLQEKRIRPLGATDELEVDFRLITATHKDLRKAIADGTFRADLYHRIAQLSLKMPALRDRIGDIGYLSNYFLTEIAGREDDNAKVLSDDALSCLENYAFLGNVRELQNIIIRAVLAAGDADVISEEIVSSVLQAISIAPEAKSNEGVHIKDAANNLNLLIEQDGLPTAMSDFEKSILNSANERFSGDRQKMAGFLKLPRRTLANKLARYKIGCGSHDEPIA